MIYGYFLWWYGAGYVRAWQIVGRWLNELADFFSLPILVKTWLSPWKNDVLSARNIALSDQVKLWEQNFASRLVGIILRTFIIVLATIIIGVIAVALVFSLLVWLFVPVLVVVLPIVAGVISLK